MPGHFTGIMEISSAIFNTGSYSTYYSTRTYHLSMFSRTRVATFLSCIFGLVLFRLWLSAAICTDCFFSSPQDAFVAVVRSCMTR